MLYSQKLMLVPDGQVCKQAGIVCVALSKKSAAELRSHTYEVCSRFGHLKASTIEARLQLAALYTATASLLPEPRAKMTGEKPVRRIIHSAELIVQFNRCRWYQDILLCLKLQVLGSYAVDCNRARLEVTTSSCCVAFPTHCFAGYYWYFMS